MSERDYEYMALALRLAQCGVYTTAPNPRVGCVIVRDDKVIGSGGHRQAGGPHAEIIALQQAGEQARGATAYVTLEPCCHHGRTGPCSQALIDAGIRRVVAAMVDPNPRVAGHGLEQMRRAGIEVTQGVLQQAAEDLNRGFISRMRDGRPFVVCKLAMSLDGRTAMASGESQWITSSAARQDVQRLRARSSAVLTGIGTVLADDPALNVRMEVLADDAALLDDGQPRQPLRIIVDTHGRLPDNARVLQSPGQVVLLTSAAGADAVAANSADYPATLTVLTLPLHSSLATPDRQPLLDLSYLFSSLAGYELNDVVVEAGSLLSGALLSAGLIDELVIYMAPKLMGHTARGLFDLPWLASMAQCIELEIRDVRPVAHDWRITASVRKR
jgi:diaminohydroxyphosphoribosylaminopyrimidine deaminase/5-amino-6-(5-phosphoribosylamino)uracil reductase